VLRKGEKLLGADKMEGEFAVEELRQEARPPTLRD
jgi:hypothetical protein